MSAPTTPRPKRTTKARGTENSQEPVTPVTPDTPPRRSAPKAAESPRQAPPRSAPRGLQKSLEELFVAPALAYSIAGDDWAAGFVTERAPILAEAWYKLAQESPPVRRILVKLTTGSAWGGVIAASLMTAVPLLAHHGLLPFALPMGDEGEYEGAPIVPPPPAPTGAAPTGAPDMTRPVAPGAPPGVVTVAGSNANHAGAR